ncbi:MAG: glycosyltransferase family 39 protein [Coriobacteriia bacterium]|nr:glycosyltransferase family 39 protein [Coriobacteriia bacterium]
MEPGALQSLELRGTMNLHEVVAKRGVSRMKGLLNPDRGIYLLLALASVLRIAAVYDVGITYDGQYIDAVRFMDSARELAASGRFTFAGAESSAYQMPGYSAFLALLLSAAESPFTEHLLVKATLLLLSLATIYMVYLLGSRVGGLWVGLVASAFLTFSMPNIYTGLLTLSENPFSLAVTTFALLVIRLGDEPGWKYFSLSLGVFILAIYLRQAALMMLPPALIYLLLRRFPRKLLWRQTAAAIMVIVAVLMPWWIRNYCLFDAFVPFTSFEGAPLLEGTYQRFDPYPEHGGAFVQMDELTSNFTGNELEKSHLFARAAHQRLVQRWRTDPLDLVFTYALGKPAAAWLLPHYWDTVLGASSYWVLRVHAVMSALGLAALLALSIRSDARYEFVFMGLCVLLVTVGTSYYLGLHRYVYPFMPFLYVAIACALNRLTSRCSQRLSSPLSGSAAASAPETLDYRGVR